MPVLGKSAIPHLVTKPHLLSHIANKNRYATLILHYDMPDIIERLNKSLTSDKTGHVVFLDIGATSVYIILRERIKHLLHGYMS